MTNRRRPDWLVQQLPVGMIEDDFLVRFVRIFQAVADSMQLQADNIPHLFDIAVAPDVMVRTIGRWLGLDWVDPSLPDALQRRIVREYSAGLLWRGTKTGMQRLLELICGGEVVVEDTGGIFARTDPPTPARPAHVKMSVETTGWSTAADLLRIVSGELPVNVTFELVVGGRTIHPPANIAALAVGATS